MERRQPTLRERLDAYIELAIRDARTQPNLPAITLIQKGNTEFINVAFEHFNEPCSGDINVQADVFRRYLETKGCFKARTETFSGGEELGFHTYLAVNGHIKKELVSDYFLHPTNHGISEGEVKEINRKLDACRDCRKVVCEVVKFY